MKGLYSRLVGAYAILIGMLLTGLGIVLGQFFPLFYKNLDDPTFNQYLLYLIIILFVAFLLSMIISMRLLLNYAKPVDDITSVVTKISKGQPVEWANHPYLHFYEDDLSIAVKEISETMEKMSTKRSVEKDRLKTLIESMGSGLLMFGRGGAVSLVNGMFRKTFGFEDVEIIGRTVNSIGLPTEIEALIEEVFMTEQGQETRFSTEVEGKSATYSVYGAPVIGNHGNWLGIVVVIHDITELIHLEEVRKDFVANVSHELRTPVTSIKGFAETLLSGAMEDREVRKNFLEIIHKESERLHSLIDDLLVLSGVERAEFKLEFTDVHVNRVIEEAIQLVSVTVKEKNMKIIFQPSSEIVVEGDAGRLIQVLVNLLSNALAYSQEGKEVRVCIEKTREQVIIIVEDEGIGIEASQLPRLFERFYRVDQARSRESGGTGLGLAIVKHLIEAHNGSVEVYSKPSVGTAFYVKLPIKQE
ncbi:two-component system histidine kinase PnpS [Sporosarcina ureilytica]|nr:ATP-binding protein [Sporosarcina ureilytica]